MINPNMTNREVCDVMFVKYKTLIPVLDMDYANVTTTEVTGETVYAYGGQGHEPRIGIDGERKGTIKIETQIVPFKLYQMMTGAELAVKADFLKKETITTTEEAPTITLTGTPATGSEVSVFVAGTIETPIEATISGNTVTLKTPTEGTYDVYYMEALSTNVKSLTIKSTTFPDYYTAFMKTIDITESGERVPFRITACKCKPQPNFTINCSNSGDPTTLTLTCDLLTDDKKRMLQMDVIEEV